jgi:hypothetical protein
MAVSVGSPQPQEAQACPTAGKAMTVNITQSRIWVGRRGIRKLRDFSVVRDRVHCVILSHQQKLSLC